MAAWAVGGGAWCSWPPRRWPVPWPRGRRRPMPPGRPCWPTPTWPRRRPRRPVHADPARHRRLRRLRHRGLAGAHPDGDDDRPGALARGPDAMPVLPPWATPDPDNSLSWAPATVALGGRYIMYMSVQQAASRRECIAAMTSASPTGPFTDALGGPLVCQLDARRARSTRRWCAMTTAGSICCGRATATAAASPSSLWVQDLRPDGLATDGRRPPTADRRPALAGRRRSRTRRCCATPRAGGGCSTRATSFDTAAYGTGVAYCPAITGPCRDDRGAFLSTAAGQFSPGGARDVPRPDRRDVGGVRHVDPTGPQRSVLLLPRARPGAPSLDLTPPRCARAVGDAGPSPTAWR